MPSTTTETTFRIHDVLRAVSSALEVPVVIVLILFLLAAAVLTGWVIAEFFTERRHLKVALPQLLEDLRTADDRAAVIEASGLLRRQKDALLELLNHPDFNGEMRETLAVRLLEQSRRYDRIVKLSELLARLAPMFGLLGTLIPLGPGIIALGQGDTYTLSTSLLTAFDTTVAGSCCRGVCHSDLDCPPRLVPRVCLNSGGGSGNAARDRKGRVSAHEPAALARPFPPHRGSAR